LISTNAIGDKVSNGTQTRPPMGVLDALTMSQTGLPFDHMGVQIAF
jgi:hypothetical protein